MFTAEFYSIVPCPELDQVNLDFPVAAVLVLVLGTGLSKLVATLGRLIVRGLSVQTHLV